MHQEKLQQQQLHVACDEEPNGPAFTCLVTAGLRAVESLHPSPLLVDPLAPGLCGPKALALAQQELDSLKAAQVRHDLPLCSHACPLPQHLFLDVSAMPRTLCHA